MFLVISYLYNYCRKQREIPQKGKFACKTLLRKNPNAWENSFI